MCCFWFEWKEIKIWRICLTFLLSTAGWNRPSTWSLCFFKGHSNTRPLQWASVSETLSNGHWTEAVLEGGCYLRLLRSPKLPQSSDVRTCLPPFHPGDKGLGEKMLIYYCRECCTVTALNNACPAPFQGLVGSVNPPLKSLHKSLRILGKHSNGAGTI